MGYDQGPSVAVDAMSSCGKEEVVLVHMPYGSLERPSIGLGLLKSALAKVRIDSRIIYANLLYAEDIGLNAYESMSGGYIELFLGEWTFSKAAFPEFEPDNNAMFAFLQSHLRHSRLKQCLNSGNIRASLMRIRKEAKNFIDRLAQEIVDRSPRIVGCSSTFNQHCSSLALLRRVRELDPSIITLIGGANCEGAMGETTLTAFKWVDYVVSGEADELIVPFCRSLLSVGHYTNPDDLPKGVFARIQTVPRTGPVRVSVENLDNVPVPDFTDYFLALPDLKIAEYIDPGLQYETARGCWWGQKSHCTFCGLNGSSMNFRSKSPNKVINDLDKLSQTHQIGGFQIVDNILDMNYFSTLLPSLIDKKYSFFFETKSNLKRPHVKMLADSGVKWIQPGIESIHDDVLKLIRKGCTAATNLQLLKWSHEYGIFVYWIFMVGIPDEKDLWYHEVCSNMPMISHLQPPSSIAFLQYHRFSPYHQNPESYDLSLRPHELYQYVYPIDDELMDGIAYYFETNAPPPQRDDRPGLDKLSVSLREWRMQHVIQDARPILEMDDVDCVLQIHDTRACAVEKYHQLAGIDRAIYKACDSAQSRASLMRALKTAGYTPIESEVDTAIEAMRDKKLILGISNKFFSLATWKTPITQSGKPRYPGGTVELDRYMHDKFVAQV